MTGNRDNDDLLAKDAGQPPARMDEVTGPTDMESVLLVLGRGLPIDRLLPGSSATADGRDVPVLCRIAGCRVGTPACGAHEGVCPSECGSLAETLRQLGWMADSASVRVTLTTDRGAVTFRLGPLASASAETANAIGGAARLPSDGLDCNPKPASAPPEPRLDDGPQPDEIRPISVWLHSDNPGLLAWLRRELAAHADLEVRPGRVLDHSQLAAHHDPRRRQVFLLDERVFDAMDREAREALRAFAVDHPVVLLLEAVSANLAREILRNRFRGYLLTACAGDFYARAIRSVCDGDFWLPRGILAEVLQDWVADAEKSRHPASLVDTETTTFTSREQQVLSLLRQGWSNKQIARELGVMEDTVKKHLQHVYDKLGVRRRTLVLARDAST